MDALRDLSLSQLKLVLGSRIPNSDIAMGAHGPVSRILSRSSVGTGVSMYARTLSRFKMVFKMRIRVLFDGFQNPSWKGAIVPKAGIRDLVAPFLKREKKVDSQPPNVARPIWRLMRVASGSGQANPLIHMK